MQEYEVVYTPRAKKKLLDIFELILVGYSNYFSAVSVTNKIIKKCGSLATAPKAAAIKMVVNGKGYRLARVNKYTIVYYIEEENKTINIMSIEYSRRDINAVIRALGKS